MVISSTEAREGLRYELDHLATFTVNSKHGLLHPEDAMRKLKLMDQSTGIWTMPCTMLMNANCVNIIDKQSGEMMEQFPMNLIVNPMSASSRPTDSFTNVLLFTVMEDPKKVDSPTEMHIFQCVSHSADNIASELKKLKGHKKSPSDGVQVNTTANYASGGEQTPTPTSTMQAAQANARLIAQTRPSESIDGSLMRPEQIDFDVNVLNHCFDDIEKFLGRLQLIANARTEMETRKKGKSKKNKKNHGDGLLIMRARPPTREEFIDTFKKFKLAFILLARLRPYIHNPNSAELVHFLMRPLNLAVGASKDHVSEMPDVALRIVSPLITAEAKDLLSNCLVSKEYDLWISLGNAWTVSRDNWNSAVPPYSPKFSDGWEPYPGGWDTESEPRARVAANIVTINGKRQEAKHEENLGEVYYKSEDTATYYDSPRTPTNRSHVHDSKMDVHQVHVERNDVDRNWQFHEEAGRRAQDGPSDSQQNNYLHDLQNGDTKIYQVTHERIGRNNKELTVAKGEYLEVLDDARNWWKTRNEHGDVGYVPFTILKFVPNDVIMDYGKMNGVGAVPPAPVPPPVLPVSEMVNISSRNNHREREVNVETTQTNGYNEAPESSSKENLHDELKRRMTMGRNGGANMRPVSKYISQESDANDVHEWLESKGFSERVLQGTKYFNGTDLFNLSKTDYYSLAEDREEAAHLESHILVQKNICGFDNQGTAELNAILRNRKRLSDLATLGQPPSFLPRPPAISDSTIGMQMPTYGRYNYR